MTSFSKIWSSQNWFSLFKPNRIFALSSCWHFGLLYFLFTDSPGWHMFIHQVFKMIPCNIVAISEGNGILILCHIFWTNTTCSSAFLFKVVEEKKWTWRQTILQFTEELFEVSRVSILLLWCPWFKFYLNKCGQTITERKHLRKKQKSSNKIQNLWNKVGLSEFSSIFTSDRANKFC